MKTLQTLRPDDHWTALGLLAAAIDKEDGTQLNIHYDGETWTVTVMLPNGTQHVGIAPNLQDAQENAATAWRLSE
jgi:hypothetical protein